MAASAFAPILPTEQWQARERAHRHRVLPWVTPRLRRRAAGAKDPVDDFLFDYYFLSPGRLLDWHPGVGHVLAGTTERGRHYRRVPGGITVDTRGIAARSAGLERSLTILTATAARAPSLRCFGLHEWAMVQGLRQDQVRHPQVPLRVDPDAVTRVVERVGLSCTHFDAYRFFTASAQPRQRRLTRERQHLDEQPGCLHAGMDLYRYAGQALPFVPSELVADCFELARRSRTVDMAASPYDLTGQGVPPIRVETPAGRREYVAHQQQLAADAEPLRTRLIGALRAVIAAGHDVADWHAIDRAQ